MIPALFLLACDPTTTANPGGDTGAWDGNTGPYITEGEQQQPPEIDLSTLGEDLSQAISHLLDYSALDIVEAYGEVADGMDGDCPEWYESDGLPYWYDSCQASDGTRFEGYAYLVPLEDYVDTDGTVYNGAQFYGIASVLDENGRAFQSRGGAGIFDATMVDGARVSYSYMEAGFSDTAATGTWLADALDPSLTTWTALYEEVDGRATSVDGTVTGLSGGIEVLVLDGLSLRDEVLDGCPLEPTSTLSVLDAEGRWIDLVFSADGPGDPACDGCGTAWFQGLALGEVCADFPPLLDWDRGPWW